MILYIKNIFTFSIVALYLLSCANISSPTGGAIDTEPPKLVKSRTLPLPNTLNYKGKVIELAFDEDIAPRSLQEQLLITPLEENSYKIIHKKDRVRLEFEKDFSPNTTYTFNFRESVRDVTEGNPAKDLIIAFSTGPYLDSAIVSGKVFDLKTNQPLDNILVSLYRSNDTLSPLNSKPLYFTNTVSGGNFRIQNIKAGTYDLYAIDDKNKNLKYEEVEKIDFEKKLLLDSTLQNVELKIAFLDSTAPQIRNKKTSGEIFEILFNEGVENIEIENSQEVYFTSSSTGKSILIYNTFQEKDSISLQIQLSDSSGNRFSEKIKIYFTEEKNEKRERLKIDYQPTDRKLNPINQSIQLNFNKPVTRYDLDKIKIIADTLIQSLKKEELKWMSKTKLSINRSGRVKDSLILIVPQKTFFFLDSSNLSDTIKFDIKQEENYGSISGTIKTGKDSYILELLDNNFQTVDTLINPVTFNFKYLYPGSYYLRIIEDQNKNRKWDQGNLKESKQPEPIHLYKDKIDLRANWEVEGIDFRF